MSQYRKILLIADPSMKQTPAYHRAAQLARATGAELHLCLFDYSSAVAALGLVSAKMAEVAKWGYIEQREQWLRVRAEHLRGSPLTVHTEMIWGAPVHERMIEKIVQIAPDLVVKDAHLEPLIKRVLFTPLDWHLLRLCPAPLLMVHAGQPKKPRRVIAAVDTAHPLPGAEGLNDRIVQAALELALQCDATAHLAQAFEDLVPVVPGEFVMPDAFSETYEELRKIQRKRFDEFADRHSVPGERRHFMFGPRVAALAQYTGQSHGDVLVLGTTYRTGFDRILLGSTAEELLGEVRCDVLAIKPEGFLDDLARVYDFAGKARKARGRAAAKAS